VPAEGAVHADEMNELPGLGASPLSRNLKISKAGLSSPLTMEKYWMMRVNAIHNRSNAQVNDDLEAASRVNPAVKQA